jgi:hypothetical protein
MRSWHASVSLQPESLMKSIILSALYAATSKLPEKITRTLKKYCLHIRTLPQKLRTSLQKAMKRKYASSWNWKRRKM